MMRQSFVNAFCAEMLKLKHSAIIGVTFIAFALAPAMGGLFMLILSHPEMAANASMLQAKFSAMPFGVGWDAYFLILSQAMGVGGILVFGFVVSWLFGREYSDHTAKDLLALPVSRTYIVLAKYLVYTLWCLSLAVSNILVMLLIGNLLQLPGWSSVALYHHLYIYGLTTVMTIAINTGIAYMAVAGRGYLAPLGFVALALVLSQIIAAAGFGPFFPWAVPAIFSGTGDASMAHLPPASYIILAIVGGIGVFGTIWQMCFADHTK